MNSLLSLLLVVSAAQAVQWPLRPINNCLTTMCTMSIKICPDGTPAPVPVGGCCPSLSACKPLSPITNNCFHVFCTMDLKICPDGTPAPVPAGGCCPSYSACKIVKPIGNDCSNTFCTMDMKICPNGYPAPIPEGECCPSLEACEGVGKRNIDLGSLLSGSNILQTLTGATHGTNLGTVLSMLNLLNNVHQLTNDIHQIPAIINETLANILNGTSEAGQMLLQQLLGHAGASQPAGRINILGALGQNANLLSSITHLLPKGTSISTILSILNLLNNVNQLNHDVHQIPVLINETLATILNGTGAAGQMIAQQLAGLLHHTPTGRINLLGALGQNANLLSSISHLLPKGTSISTILSLLNLLNNVNALNHDVHQIPLVINQTLTAILNGTGAATQTILSQLLSIIKPPTAASRNLLDSLGQNANLLSSITHLLPQGTSIQTILSLISLLSNVNALNSDLHQIPAVLQETINAILSGVQQLIPPTLQPVVGGSS